MFHIRVRTLSVKGACDEGAMRGVVVGIAAAVGMRVRLVSLRRRHASVMPLTVVAIRAIRYLNPSLMPFKTCHLCHGGAGQFAQHQYVLNVCNVVFLGALCSVGKVSLG